MLDEELIVVLAWGFVNDCKQFSDDDGLNIFVYSLKIKNIFLLIHFLRYWIAYNNTL